MPSAKTQSPLLPKTPGTYAALTLLPLILTLAASILLPAPPTAAVRAIGSILTVIAYIGCFFGLMALAEKDRGRKFVGVLTLLVQGYVIGIAHAISNGF